MRKIIFYKSPDGIEEPCPFCPSLVKAYEAIERQVPFEKTMIKIDTNSDEPLTQLAEVAGKSITGLDLIRAPTLIINKHAYVGTRGRKYFNGVLKEVLKDCLSLS